MQSMGAGSGCSASLSDWLDNAVPIEWLVDLLDLVRRTPSLDWLLLTKRIGNFKKRLADASDYVWNSGAGAIADAVSLREWVDEWRSGHPLQTSLLGLLLSIRQKRIATSQSCSKCRHMCASFRWSHY
jgi:protein gp37